VREPGNVPVMEEEAQRLPAPKASCIGIMRSLLVDDDINMIDLGFIIDSNSVQSALAKKIREMGVAFSIRVNYRGEMDDLGEMAGFELEDIILKPVDETPTARNDRAARQAAIIEGRKPVVTEIVKEVLVAAPAAANETQPRKPAKKPHFDERQKAPDPKADRSCGFIAIDGERTS